MILVADWIHSSLCAAIILDQKFGKNLFSWEFSLRIYDWFQLKCHFCLIQSVKVNWDNFKILFDIFQLFCDCQIFIAAFCFYLFQAFPVTCLQFKIAFPIILINLIFVYDVDASISCAFFAFLYSQFNNLPYFIVYLFAFVCSLFRQSDVWYPGGVLLMHL